MLFKMHGTVDNPSSMIITEDDIWQFIDKLPTISIVLKAFFATKTLLFIGYNLSDINFKRLYTEVVSSVDRHQRRAFAVQLEPSSYDLKWWARKNVEITNGNTLDFLSALVNVVSSSMSGTETTYSSKPKPSRPYKFLDYFEENDVDIFFGRIQENTDVIKRILAHKVTVLYGASGTGKTSLLKAGIIPTLISEGYQSIYVRALQNPEQTIKDEFSKIYSHPYLDPSSTSLSEFFQATIPPNSRYLIILDQFEEFFLRQGNAFRRQFAKTIGDCIQLGQQDIRFLISMRDDYFVRLDELEESIPSIFENKYRLDNLDENRARVAITEPAKYFGLEFSPELLDHLVKDLDAEGFEPTQLQIICYRLYENLSASRKVFNLEDYQILGSAAGILSKYLDEVLSNFESDEDRESARSILKSMVTSEATKDALSAQEITRDTIVRKLGLGEKRVTELLEKLRNNRIIRKLADPELYELAHEVLVKKVWEWISQEDIVYKYTRSAIRQALSDWQRLNILLDSERWRLVNEQKEIISLSNEELELILRSAIFRGDQSEYWFQRALATPLPIWDILTQIVSSDKPHSRHNALGLLQTKEEPASLNILNIAVQTEYPALIRQARRILSSLKDKRARQILDAVTAQQDMIYIPSGDCIIGQNKSPMQEQTEEPEHKVFVDDFWIARYPVTNIEYLDYVRATNCKLPDHWVNGIIPEGKEDHPITYISWYDAVAYCEWLTMKTGKLIRLPTEAEWEKVASWDSTNQSRRTFPYGDDFDKNKCNVAESEIGNTCPIGQFSCVDGDSPYGCCDMAGNVWEWCNTRATDDEDRYYKYPYISSDGREDKGGNGMRVVRGGSFNYSYRASRCSARAWRNAEYRSWHYGFRLAMSNTKK
jgi:formylglycine-generating enzyme required for sulfatase activity